MTDQIYLEEFLYRGRPPGSDQEPAYHIVLGVVGQDAFGKSTLATSGALTPEQAMEHGITLPAVLDAVNADLIDQNAALKATKEAQAQRIVELEALASQRAMVRGVDQEESTDFQAMVDTLQSELAGVRSQLVRASAELAETRAQLEAVTAEPPASPQVPDLPSFV
jgi:uncharacterized protein (DUF1800 family)